MKPEPTSSSSSSSSWAWAWDAVKQEEDALPYPPPPPRPLQRIKEVPSAKSSISIRPCNQLEEGEPPQEPAPDPPMEWLTTSYIVRKIR